MRQAFVRAAAAWTPVPHGPTEATAAAAAVAAAAADAPADPAAVRVPVTHVEVAESVDL